MSVEVTGREIKESSGKLPVDFRLWLIDSVPVVAEFLVGRLILGCRVGGQQPGQFLEIFPLPAFNQVGEFDWIDKIVFGGFFRPIPSKQSAQKSAEFGNQGTHERRPAAL